MRQGVRLEPLLDAISDFLDSQHEIVERARRDRGLRKPRKGRRGLTAPQVMRSLAGAGVEVVAVAERAVGSRVIGRAPAILRVATLCLAGTGTEQEWATASVPKLAPITYALI